jgi:hypothetical protein
MPPPDHHNGERMTVTLDYTWDSSPPPVALASVPPASHTSADQSRFGARSQDGDVFGETPAVAKALSSEPKTAVETTALPKATKSFRIRRLPPIGRMKSL